MRYKKRHHLKCPPLPGAFKMILILFLLLNIAAMLMPHELMAAELYGFIKSADVKQFDEAIDGFKESFPEAAVKVINLKRKRDLKKVSTFISSKKPSVIICLGAGAAITTAKIEKKIPIIFSMVLNYKRYKSLKQSNITGVSMEILPATLFTQFRLLYTGLKVIGVPYHPDASSEIVQDAIKASKQLGLKILPIEVNNPEDLGGKLSENKSLFNGLWMIGDFKLYNKKTKAYKVLIEFSRENKKPLLAVSEPFIKAGACFSVSTDNRSLGSQIALVSKQIVHDKLPPVSIKVAPPIGTFTVINKNIAKEILGNQFDESIIGISQ